MIVFNSRDGHLSRLLQFWLDTVSPLAALLESVEAGELMPEKAVSDTQTTLHLMGNVHQQMSQERRKKLILKFNLSLKFMVEDNKSFVSSFPMLFGEEFASSYYYSRVSKGNEEAKCSSREKRVFPDTTPKLIKAATV